LEEDTARFMIMTKLQRGIVAVANNLGKQRDADGRELEAELVDFGDPKPAARRLPAEIPSLIKPNSHATHAPTATTER
jgi:hypothetical protein